jgi:acetate kinase
MHIVLFNAGSSSLKCSLFELDGAEPIAQAQADWASTPAKYQFSITGGDSKREEVAWRGHGEAVRRFLDDVRACPPQGFEFGSLQAAAHRIVHGGEFSSSVLITPEIQKRIAALAELAPLHNPPSLEALAAAQEALPNIPQVAVFDTAFHSTLPSEARVYPIPGQWTNEWGIRRYGFHGLSHSYCSRRAAEMLGRPMESLRIIVCHLGHGCSAAVVQNGKCIDTTMGFTPLDGLMMATRCGSIDPSIVLHVQQRHGLSAEQVDSALNRQSGLLGVSGTSADMRQVLDAAKKGDERAQLAIAIYSHRVRKTIGAGAVTMGGVDALVFTAGVGEHSADIRKLICAGLECVGLELDETLNSACDPDKDVAKKSSKGRILVIATREDLTMLRETRHVLSKA